MEANELRIGNKIMVPHYGETFNNLYEVTVLSLTSDGEIETDAYGTMFGTTGGNINSSVPIPINEAWILKLGFVPIDDDGEFEHPDEPLFQLKNMYLSQTGFAHIWDGAYTNSPCFYVHQLQNLFFALTGKELKYEM